MAVKKYPIGTKIRYVGIHGPSYLGEQFTNMVGTLVGIVGNYPLIYLPKAVSTSEYSTKEQLATIQTSWSRIEILAQKNQQLLFDFAYE